MPRRPAFPTPCATPGCSALTRDRHCSAHKLEGGRAERAPRRESRRIYDTARWRRFSSRYRDKHPFCARCEAAGRIAASELVHHLVPVRDDGDVFDEANVEAICWRCHPTAEAEARGEGG